jgi:hypothetical protein
MGLKHYQKGRYFIGAALLLRKHGGDEYVVLHLLCQGVEIVLKALLLLHDFDKYRTLLKGYGHAAVASRATAQMKPANSRATAVMATVLSLPLLIRAR